MQSEVLIKVTTTGSAGSASGTGTSDLPVRGFIESIQCDYHASAPATTDLTLAESGGMLRTFYTRANTVTDAIKYPRILLQDTVGADLTAIYGRFFVPGHKLIVALAQCDALPDAVVVRVLISEF